VGGRAGNHLTAKQCTNPSERAAEYPSAKAAARPVRASHVRVLVPEPPVYILRFGALVPRGPDRAARAAPRLGLWNQPALGALPLWRTDVVRFSDMMI